jgi:putative transposase
LQTSDCPANLERVRSSTNLSEHLFGRVRAIGRQVKRWPNGPMLLRGTAAGGLQAARGFRKLVGYRARPILVAAWRAHDAQCNRTARRVDGPEKAA